MTEILYDYPVSYTFRCYEAELQNIDLPRLEPSDRNSRLDEIERKLNERLSNKLLNQLRNEQAYLRTKVMEFRALLEKPQKETDGKL